MRIRTFFVCFSRTDVTFFSLCRRAGASQQKPPCNVRKQAAKNPMSEPRLPQPVQSLDFQWGPSSDVFHMHTKMQFLPYYTQDAL